jgi:hypothetical protein
MNKDISMNYNQNFLVTLVERAYIAEGYERETS